MAVDVGLYARAHVGDSPQPGVGEKASEASGGKLAGALLALLCLVEVVWIAAVVYGVFLAQDFVRSLL